jgi:dCMP deaminase
MYEGKLPIRLIVSNIKTQELTINCFHYHRQPCEITVLACKDEWTDAIKKWYRYVFDTFSAKYYTIINYKIDGKVYEYDKDGNVTISFDVYGIFPIMLDEDPYTITFSADSVGALEKAKDYKTENLFVENVPTLSDAAENGPLPWDSYFMNIAVLASLRSKDSTKVGAVIVKDKKIIGVGYNGFPSGIDESKLPTERECVLQDSKYAYTVHAELNALLNTVQHDISGASVYVTLFPCCRCMSTLMQKKVSEIVYLSDKHHDEPEYIASRRLLSLSSITAREFKGEIIVNR